MIKVMQMSRGFSLLEMIVVLGLLLLVLAVVLPNVLNVKQKGSDNALLTEYQRVVLAIEQYHLRCGEYPIDDNKQLVLSAANGCVSGDLGDMLDQLPTLPHVYIPLSFEALSGTCDRGYVFALQTTPGSSVLLEDHDYEADPNNVPYFCSSGDFFSGDDADGWYDKVYPEALRL